MIIKSEVLKKYCNTILQAVDSNELSVLTETLELKTIGNTLFMNVTNKEYFAQVKLGLTQAEDLHATVSANLFLKLISQITTDDIGLRIQDTYLEVKGNGVYKLPLIFDNDKLLELPEIKIENETNNFDIDGAILGSILQYNSKELTKGIISRPIQRLYYVDEIGAITFTSGACVNSFMLSQPVRMLLNDKLVKLFKLFQNNNVKFTLGHNPISDTIIQTVVKFETDDIILTAIISCDDSMLNSVPASAIRGRANNDYPYLINLDKNELLQTINRLMLFNSGNGVKESLKPYSKFKFSEDKVTIFDAHGNNSEDISYKTTKISDTYEAIFDLVDLKSTLDTCVDSCITLKFGDGQAAVLARGSVANVIPEVRSV